MEPRTVSIYALVDPRTQQVRYIGQTCDIKKRYNNINAPSHSSKSIALNEWVKSIKSSGLKPIMVILQETTQDIAGALEQEWMIRFQQAGAKLINQRFNKAPDYLNSARHVYKRYLDERSAPKANGGQQG